MNEEKLLQSHAREIQIRCGKYTRAKKSQERPGMLNPSCRQRDRASSVELRNHETIKKWSPASQPEPANNDHLESILLHPPPAPPSLLHIINMHPCPPPSTCEGGPDRPPPPKKTSVLLCKNKTFEL